MTPSADLFATMRGHVVAALATLLPDLPEDSFARVVFTVALYGVGTLVPVLAQRAGAPPSAPASRNPAETMIAPWMPRAPQSATMPGTLAAGVTITARSTASGRSRTLR